MYRFLRALFFSLLILMCTACNGDRNGDSVEPSARIERLPVALRESGYRSFDSQFISGQTQLTEFLAAVETSEEWVNKDDIFQIIADAGIDFDLYNLVIYRKIEPSGATTFSPQIPFDSGSFVHIEIEINELGEGLSGAQVEAYWAVFYKVAKTVDAVVFALDGKGEYLAEPGNYEIVPRNCKIWFDGCNTCSEFDSSGVACTKIHCDVYGSAYCVE